MLCLALVIELVPDNASRGGMGILASKITLFSIVHNPVRRELHATIVNYAIDIDVV
jgi:hypothetical protein